MGNERREHQGGMPDADYFRSIAEAEYAWFHRMEPDPLEGFKDDPHRGTNNVGPESTDVGNP